MKLLDNYVNSTPPQPRLKAILFFLLRTKFPIQQPFATLGKTHPMPVYSMGPLCPPSPSAPMAVWIEIG